MNTTKTILLLTGVAMMGGLKLEAQTTPGPQPNICNRPCWAARAPNCGLTTMTSLTRAIVHHTAAPSDWNTTSIDTSKPKIRAVQNYHMDAQGWCDIGYHFLVDKLGNIFEGRDNSMFGLRRGIHDACNGNSFGFTLLGYFHPPYNHVPTTEMLNSYYATIAWRMPAGWSPYGSGTYCGKTVGFLDGHKKVVATACPGDNVHPNLITENYFGGPMRTSVAQRRTPAPPTGVVVDNQAATYLGTWSVGTSSGDKYGPDYRFRSTAAVSEPATFTGNITAGTKTVYAWWPAGSNRSTTAPYIVAHAGGTTTVSKNQQVNGGSWQSLGSWSFNAGNNTVKLSCWTGTGFVVMADAVMWQ